jgi:hypothetical protein
MFQVILRLLEDLFELRVLVRFSRELPLKIRGQFLRLHQVILQCLVVRHERATEIRIHQPLRGQRHSNRLHGSVRL